MSNSVLLLNVSLVLWQFMLALELEKLERLPTELRTQFQLEFMIHKVHWR
jgi:hypothetical protein